MDEKGGAAERREQMYDRKITLADGRYLIFYTFGKEPDTADDSLPKPPTDKATPQKDVRASL